MASVDRNYALDQNYTAAFLADDRHERAIVLHMVLSFVGGMVLGALGAVLSYGPDGLYAIYEPYAYVLFVVVVGRTAASLGWAALTSALATFGPIIALLAASIFKSGGDFLSLGTNGVKLNFTLFTLACFGLLAYFTRHEDLWGDLAGGALAGLVMIDGMNKALPDGPQYVPGFWPWSALIVVALATGLLLSLRRGSARLRSALVALIIASAYFVFVVGL
ncbi:hypothetical protein ACQPYK_11380 [Streptosporangium sp. CA-135522]|uniref:hypothetical protein n=1 Tax=Streptosporangium sp. CA-135522 TaxID=3240072 RepID=UPI003D93F126